VAFGPDGATVATGSEDQTVRLWDVATSHQIGLPLSGDTSIITALAYNPDGKVLASADNDGQIRLWDVAQPVDKLNAVCVIAERRLTRQQWNTYIPSQPFQRIC